MPNPQQSQRSVEQRVTELAEARQSLAPRDYNEIQRAVSSLGLNRVAPKQVIVAGTNGKGTTVTYLQQLLTNQGFRVGTTTSPHIHCYLERISEDGKRISEREWMTSLNEVEKGTEGLSLTYFDLTTLIAFHVFAKREVDVAVVEVGLGGRLDTANTLDPDVSIVTNIGLDHQNVLGPTIQDITREKLGIARPGVPLLFGGSDDNELVDELAQKVGAPLVRNNPEQQDQKNYLRWNGRDCAEKLKNLPPRTLVETRSLSLALQACEYLNPGFKPTLGDIDGLQAPRGRLECIELNDRLWVLDIAHNADGVSFLRQRLMQLDISDFVSVFGCMQQKDAASMLQALTSNRDDSTQARTQQIVITNTSGLNGRSAESLYELAVSYRIRQLELKPKLHAALQRALSINKELPIVVFGSVDIVARAFEWLSHKRRSAECL